MKKLIAVVVTMTPVFFLLACGSDRQETSSDFENEDNVLVTEHEVEAVKARTIEMAYKEEPFIPEFPLADSALKYSTKGKMNEQLAEAMRDHANMISSNLQGMASVIQYGEGIIVTLDQGDIFGSGEFVLNENSRKILRHLAFNLQQMPDTYILVAGRADSDGSSKNNDKLAYNRAAAVANYLHGCGIDGDRFFVDSFGEKYPDFANNTHLNKSKNRRVDFLILPSNDLRKVLAVNY
jgi:outer membrane protein OmpA-like peptidoglycan-associated protein